MQRQLGLLQHHSNSARISRVPPANNAAAAAAAAAHAALVAANSARIAAQKAAMMHSTPNNNGPSPSILTRPAGSQRLTNEQIQQLLASGQLPKVGWPCLNGVSTKT